MATQFIPPGGLPANTPIGTDGTTLENVSKIADISTVADGAVQESQAGEPGGFVALDANGVAQFTGSGFTVPMTQGDTTSPLQVGYYANYRELTYRVTTPGGNILAFENLASNGYAAITFRGPDNYGNPTAAFGSTSFEHGAIGYGPDLNWGQSRGYTFWEISSFDGNSSATLRSVPGIIQETGAHFSSYQEAQAVINYNTNTLKTVDGSLWPAGIDGQVIVCQTTPDAFGRTTTIVSGAGTDTITLSENMYTDSRDKTVGDLFRFGPTIYSQTDHTVSQSCGNWDYYRFQDAYNGYIYKTPFFSIDRVAGRVGINRNDPKTDFHAVGQALFSTTSKYDEYSLRFNAAVAINVVPGGVASGNYGATTQNSLFYWYGIGKNALLCNWTAANQIQFVDVNYRGPTLTIDMDGSQRVKIEKLFGLPSLTKAEILAIPGDDGDCVMCSDLGVPVVYSSTNSGWFPITVGTKLS